MSPERWREIEEVFQAAVEMPPAERVPYLAERCGNDEELRSEVLKLLDSDDSAADFIEVPIWTGSRSLNTLAKNKLSNSMDRGFNGGDRDNFLGKEVGVYKLTTEIGRGVGCRVSC